jgi:hypothetical protein
MLSVKTARHIRSLRNRKSFRACPTSTGIPRQRSEASRQDLEDDFLKDGEARRLLLARQWAAHCRRCRPNGTA